MKTRITLTIDPEISHRARVKAREQGTSVSGLVEHLLAEATAGPKPKKTPGSIAERWSGKLTLSGQTGPRQERLKRKYLR